MSRLKYLLFFFVPVLFGCDQDNVFDDAEQLRVDIELIENYLADNNIQAFSFENGVHIAVQSQGSGIAPSFGSTVICDYRGYLLDGTEFDSSAGRGAFDFVIGRGEVIAGWEFAFQELTRGTQATIFIPSALGYGNRRQGGIPPNSVLIFDVTLIDVRL